MGASASIASRHLLLWMQAGAHQWVSKMLLTEDTSRADENLPIAVYPHPLRAREVTPISINLLRTEMGTTNHTKITNSEGVARRLPST